MKKVVSFVILGLITLSCERGKENTADTSTLDESEFTDQRKAFFNSLLEPAEVATLLQAATVEFNPGLLSDPSTYEIYIGNEVKAAANLGIYLSDLNYCVAYDTRQFSKKYFTAALKLSESLGIDKAILEFLMKRYQSNLEQNDSLKTIVNDLWVNAAHGFQGTARERLVGIAMSAYEIENLHLIIGVIKSYPTGALTDGARATALVPLYKRLLSQRSNLVIIYNFIRAYSDPLDPDKNPNYPYYAKALEELITFYKELNAEEKIANNREAELMTEDVVKALSEKVTVIRNKIVHAE